MIRSLTIGLPLDAQSTSEIASRVRALLEASATAFAAAGLAPRTRRFTLPPAGPEDEAEGVLLSKLRWVDDLARATGVRWFCLPLDLVRGASRHGRLSQALDAVDRFERAFVNLVLAADGRTAVNAVHDAARFVLDVSRRSNNGFDNFRVGASFSCPANAPFFPFSRHEGPGVAFSLALETTQLAARALASHGAASDAGAVRDLLAGALAPALRELDGLGRRIAEESGAEYRGLDASLAPLPAEDVSVAALVESVIGAPVGSHASVFATAFLTDALRCAVRDSGARTVGFNGVMYSLLEDRLLAAANNQRRLTLDGLLALSTVCACGIDMVPVPGRAFPEEIAALMLDVAALSCSLGKPLGVRLLPIPGAHVNEFTRLNLDFLCDSRVVGLTSNDRRFATREPLLELRAPRRGAEGAAR